MTKQAQFDRFHEAQEGRSFGLPSFKKAFDEIQAGRKTSHWIWYVLPQLKELGMSSTAKRYGLVNFQETCEYLHDPLLFANYHKITQEILFQLQYTSVRSLMGSSIDAKKLMSSLTLFREAADYLANQKKPAHDYRTLQKNCELILARAAEEKLVPCKDTLSLIKQEQISTELPMANASPLTSPPTKKEERSSPVVTSPKKEAPSHSALISDLDTYIKHRRNEWSYHYNFLGIIAVLYFIQDRICGTDHFNNKSREVKLSAASKLKDWLSEPHSESPHFTGSERQALEEGRLGNLINTQGGLNSLLQNQAPSLAQAASNKPMKFN